MISGIAPINPLSKGIGGISTSAAPTTGVTPGQSFAAMVSEAASRTIDTMQAAEQVSGGGCRDERGTVAPGGRRNPRQDRHRIS